MALGNGSSVGATTSYSLTTFISEVQKAIGATVDGKASAGGETITKTVTISKLKNNTHKVVLPVQKRLNYLGFSVGAEDGNAGTKFDAGMKAYQKSFGGTQDGEATAKGKTWRKLLGIE